MESGAVIFAVLAAALGAVQPAGFRTEVRIEGTAVTLADVADLSALPPSLRMAAETLVVARLPDGAVEARLDSRRVSERARAQLPGLSAWLPDRQAIVIQVRAPGLDRTARPQPPQAACSRLVRDVAAGAFLTIDDLEPAACAGATPRLAVRFDSAAGVVRATRDLSAGELVTAPAFETLSGVRPGQALYVAVTVGPVAVERQVEALRPARPGARIHVRSATGAPFTVPPVETDR